ncbi:secreted protease B domain protein [Synechococcus sp. RS9907]|nr:secreted protease B domain protein [Synechococcus sp. RS9907]
MIENATGRKSDDLLIGNNASNRLKGKKGDDVLYASTGSKKRLIGGKGRDKFLIDSDQEAFVVV